MKVCCCSQYERNYEYLSLQNYVASKWFDAALDDLQPKPTYRLDQESNTYKPYVDRSKSDFYERTTPEFFVKPEPSKKSSFLLKCFGK